MTGLVILAVGAAVMAVVLFSMWTLSYTGVPVRASSPEAIQAALDLLALTDGERFVDLGCGFGDALRGARRRADVEAVGYELNPFAVAGAALRTDRRTRVRLADFRRQDLKGFQAVFFYLMPKFLQKNAAWLEQAFAPGTRVVAIDFPVPGWKAAAVREVGPLRQPIHLYVVGRHREGAQAGNTEDLEIPRG